MSLIQFAAILDGGPYLACSLKDRVGRVVQNGILALCSDQVGCKWLLESTQVLEPFGCQFFWTSARAALVRLVILWSRLCHDSVKEERGLVGITSKWGLRRLPPVPGGCSVESCQSRHPGTPWDDVPGPIG